jgi:RimJ/RimL family protein N-acetyltransferase
VTADVVLLTERLKLRRLCADDVTQLIALDSDPEVMRFISKGEPRTRAEFERVFLPRMLGYWRPWPPQGFWVAHLQDGDEFVGWFHLRPDKIDPGEMELGYRLTRTSWGRGLATEGAQILVGNALGDWGYAKVSARTLVDNLASRRVMEKAGLRFEREFYWNADELPGWTEPERRGVKYALGRNEPAR